VTGSIQCPICQAELEHAGVREVHWDLSDCQEAALRELLDVADKMNERGEPAIGSDPIGTVNWLLDFADKVRIIVAKAEGEKHE
jgi:hypothetical protein